MATMANYVNSTDITVPSSEVKIPKDSSSVPSGFVLKLYQMVNEAPDEIITVSGICVHRCLEDCHFFLQKSSL